MKILGRVLQFGTKQEGESASGFWTKQELIITKLDDSDRPLAVVFFGERKVNQLKDLQPGTMVEITCDVASREYQGRWYTECNGYGVKIMEAKTAIQTSLPTPGEVPPSSTAQMNDEDPVFEK